MLPIKQKIKNMLVYARSHPLKTGGIAVVVLAIVTLPWLFLPKSLPFSYAGSSCVGELTFMPRLHSQTSTVGYVIEYEEYLRVGSYPIASTKVCFNAQETPEPGDVKIATAFLGGWIARQQYTLQVGEQPKVDVAALAKPIPTTKPLSIPLDQPDVLHRYELSVDEKATICSSSDRQLLCNIEQLNLSQGKQYDYKLAKSFDDEEQNLPVSAGTLRTLKATRVTKTSIKKNQMVYAKPTKITINVDKPIVSFAAELKADGEVHPIQATHEESSITIALKEPLRRESKYTLKINAIEASDGSTMVDPYLLPFQVSGGPKVSSVNIGTSRVDQNSRIVIGFDQELSEKQNIGSLISLKGGSATVSKINSRQVAIQLNSLGRCTPFTLFVAGGVLSKYDIKNSAGWSYNSRTICYTTTVYGTSVEGRPLVAYYFGSSGPVTLYTGAIHGNEVSSKYMMESWIADLEANAGQIGNRRIVVIPSINPDGVAAGTRNNARNVNLSRNFPTDNWVRDINDTNGPLKDGGGTKPLSEPEVAALSSLVQRLRPRLLVSYHAVGSLVVGDPGGFSATKASRYAGLVGYRDATGEGGTFDYDITGSFEEWAYHNAGVPSMVVELGSYSYHNFAHHRIAMWAMLD